MIDWLNNNLGAVQAISTVILAIITGFYAVQTFKTNKIMSRQIVAETELKLISFKTGLLNSEIIDNLKESLKKKRNFINIRFNVQYSVRNKSAAYGSIVKPSLFIYLKSDMKLLKLITPRSGKNGIGMYKVGESPSEMLALKKLTESEQESDRIIYLKPNEIKIIEEVYSLFVDCEKPTKNIHTIINSPKSLKYELQYLDENCKKKIIVVDESRIGKEGMSYDVI